MNAGVEAPEGTIIDASGRPTRDPRVLFEEPTGALRTFAGHKGHALAMVCELLGAAMTGGVTGRDEHLPDVPGVINNMLAIVFDPARLGTGASFERECSGFIDWVRSSRPDEIGEALGGVLMPGDPERLSRAARATHIPFDTGTLDELAAAARRVEEGLDAAGDVAGTGTGAATSETAENGSKKWTASGTTSRVPDPRTLVDDRHR